MIKLTKIFISLLICFTGDFFAQTTSFYDFEADVDGFSIHTTGSLSASIISSSDEFYEGSKSLKIEITNNDSGNIQLIKRKDVSPGDVLFFKFYIKTNESRVVNIKSQYIGDTGYGGTETLQSNVNLSASTWTEITTEIVVSDVCPLASGGTPINIFVGFIDQNLSNDQGLVYYVDSYTIEDRTPSTPGGDGNETTGGGNGTATILYVSPNGDDANSGTIGSPLKTIAAATNLVASNGVIKLRGGVYNETVVWNESQGNGPFTMEAIANETPVISGLDPIINWTVYSGNIYFASVADEVSQLFVDANQMEVARWPNLMSDDLFNQKYGSADQVDYNLIGQNSTLSDSNLSELASLDLIGAKVWLPYPFKTKWNSLTETVHTQTATSIGFTSSENFEENNTEVDYHLTGKLDLLDAEKEWFYDTVSNRLYFYAPNGVDPSTLNVLARTRLNGIEINGSNIAIKGVDFFASTIAVVGDNNLIESCNIKYPRPFYHTQRWKEEAGVSIKGKFNTIRKCEVAYSWGSGISIRKLNSNNPSEDNHVENCLVHDVNWTGSIAPGIWMDGTRLTAKGNTVYNCGRSGIRIYRVYNSLFEYNHVYNYGLINHDLGGIKGGLQDYEHSEWRYNFTHDSNLDNAKAGIYLDASNNNALLHHNVMYNVHLSINGEVNNDKVYNNTLVADDSNQKTWSHYIRSGEDWDYRSVFTYNNLTTNEVKGTELKNNLKISDVNSLGFVGVEYGDFRLIKTSPAINYGIDIPEITDNAIDAPDAGAFEFDDFSDKGNWMPGINWSPDWNQLPVGNLEAINTEERDFTFKVVGDDDIDGWIMRYDWDFGDGTKAYGKTVNHSYQSEGIYTVSLSLKDNMGGVQTVSEDINVTTLSIEDEVLKIAQIYPNPVNNHITIKSDLTLQSIKIIDMYGRTLYVTDKLKVITNTLNISHLATGIYFIELVSENNSKQSYKIIKK